MGSVLKSIISKVNTNNKVCRIIFPEGWNKLIQEAGQELVLSSKIKPVLVFRHPEEVPSDLSPEIEKIVISEYDLVSLSNKLFELRKEKGMTIEQAQKLVLLPNYFATMLLKNGDVDGYVGGIEMTTKDTLKPSLQIIKTGKKSKIVTSAFLMERENERYLWGDCAIILDPKAEELKEIAKSITSLASAMHFDSKNVAMLSYSTAGSGSGESADKVREALNMLKNDPDFEGQCDLEYQFDSAYDVDVRSKKAPNSIIKNKHSDIFIFPNLDSGNISYKIAQRLGNFEATGPILTGLAKPVNDLSRGASKDDIINVSYITASQILSNEE